jgi:hypothetical protein
MREVKNLALGMREAIANIKKLSADAKSGLDSEVSRALVNADKVRSFTRELSDANQEVEQFLGDTGSNFPPSDGSTPPQSGAISADINGVTVNKDPAA